MVILDTTAEEQERDATKEGQRNSTEDNRIGGRIGQEGEGRKSYSAAVIDGIKRNTTIYVGDSIIRKTDSRLSKGEDVVVCLLDLLDLRAMLGFERCQSANKGLPLGSVIDQLGGIDGVEASRMEVVFD